LFDHEVNLRVISNRMSFRNSRFIDFNSGTLPVPPMDLLGGLPVRSKQTPEQMQFSFECRVEIWMLGPAVEVLKAMESQSDKHSIWSHSGYALLGMSFGYFEMIGKILNPASKERGSAGMDFNFGFCDVYPAFAISGDDRSDRKLPVVSEFRNRVRNGIFHLGYTKSHLYIHHRPSEFPHDFSVELKGAETYYFVNPHNMTRTIVDHFPSVMNRLRNSAVEYDGLRKKFREFYVDFHQGLSLPRNAEARLYIEATPHCVL
jgi:hypothetical protein